MSRTIVIVSHEPAPEGLDSTDMGDFAVHGFVCAEGDNPADYRAVLNLCRSKRAAGVLAGTASALPLASWAAESLGLSGNSIHVAQLMTDRALLLERLRVAGVPTVPFRAAGGENEAIGAARALGEPVVVHAVGSARSRYVQHLPEAGLAYRQVTKHGASKRVVVAHPAGSVRRSVLSFVIMGELRVAAVVNVSVDGQFLYPAMLGVPERVEDGVCESHGEIARAVVDALRIRNGVLRVDVVEGLGGLQVLGADMCPVSGWMPYDIVKTSGIVDFYAGAVRLCAGEPPPEIRAAGRAAAIVWLRCPAGEVTSIEGIEAARAIPGVEAVHLRIRPGDVVRHTVDEAGRNRIGFAVVHGADTASCEDRARQVTAAIAIRTRTAYEGGPDEMGR